MRVCLWWSCLVRKISWADLAPFPLPDTNHQFNTATVLVIHYHDRYFKMRWLRRRSHVDAGQRELDERFDTAGAEEGVVRLCKKT